MKKKRKEKYGIMDILQILPTIRVVYQMFRPNSFILSMELVVELK
jgi:hypothetical protein